MKWNPVMVEERGQIWTDYVSYCRKWRCAQGYNDDPDKPWSLFRAESSRERWVSDHTSLSKAKSAAEVSEE